jgi:hypothetical protein
VITQIHKSIRLILALACLSVSVTSLAQSEPPESLDNDQQERFDEQASINEESIPVQPTPYMVDDDPAIHAEPIDDDGDF